MKIYEFRTKLGDTFYIKAYSKKDAIKYAKKLWPCKSICLGRITKSNGQIFWLE